MEKDPSFEKPPQRMSDEEIKGILEKYPQLEMDKGSQHLMVEKADEEGKWIKSVYLPVWKEIPRIGKESLKIEDAIETELGLKEKEENES